MKYVVRLQKGFTIVELVTVIILVGILSATAMPKFFEKSGYQERVIFDDTLNAVRYAQKLAVATGCNVQFGISNDEFRLLQAESCLSTIYNKQVAHPATNTAPYTGSEPGISLPSTLITFTALGEAAGSSSIIIASKTITIVPSTGFVYAE